VTLTAKRKKWISLWERGELNVDLKGKTMETTRKWNRKQPVL